MAGDRYRHQFGDGVGMLRNELAGPLDDCAPPIGRVLESRRRRSHGTLHPIQHRFDRRFLNDTSAIFGPPVPASTASTVGSFVVAIEVPLPSGSAEGHGDDLWAPSGPVLHGERYSTASSAAQIHAPTTSPARPSTFPPGRSPRVGGSPGSPSDPRRWSAARRCGDAGPFSQLPEPAEVSEQM
ncbi:MAG: hypothetical protein R2789_11560 [Microthrixaceae bacterium]